MKNNRDVIIRIITQHLRGAEMRGACSNHSEWAELLYTELKPWYESDMPKSMFIHISNDSRGRVVK